MKDLSLSFIQKQNDIQGQLLFLTFDKTVSWQLGPNLAFGNLEWYFTNPACTGWQKSNAMSTKFLSTITWQQKSKWQQQSNSNVTEFIHKVMSIHQENHLKLDSVHDIFL